jgi:hypothetical protein
MSSRLTSESRIYAEKAKDLSRQVFISCVKTELFVFFSCLTFKSYTVFTSLAYGTYKVTSEK